MNKKYLINELKQEGFSERIIDAFQKVNRQDFIPKEFREFAYKNEPISIGFGQTISQPYTIAFMLNLLSLKDGLKILEIGSGSGYVLALLDEIVKDSKLYGIERIKELAERSKKIFKDKKNIEIIHGDGSKGLKKYALYDRIIISAAAENIPQNLMAQLRFGGIMVLPVNSSIISIEKKYRNNKITEYPGFSFVPLIEDE